jgi:hypothetical protein
MAAAGCVDIKNAGDVAYHLVGNVGNRTPGERVAVLGTIGDHTSCPGTGPVIAVKEITVLPR